MPAPHHSVFTGRLPFLPPHQQRQSTEGRDAKCKHAIATWSIHSEGVHVLTFTQRVLDDWSSIVCMPHLMQPATLCESQHEFDC